VPRRARRPVPRPPRRPVQRSSSMTLPGRPRMAVVLPITHQPRGLSPEGVAQKDTRWVNGCLKYAKPKPNG
jgi:hypothetical protein